MLHRPEEEKKTHGRESRVVLEAAGERQAKHTDCTGRREQKEGTVEKELCSCKECRRRAAPERTTASMDPLHPPCVAEELSTHGRQCAMPLLVE